MRSNVFYGEDLCLNLQILPRAEKIVVLPDELYFYRWGGGTTKLKASLIEDAHQQHTMKYEYFRLYGQNKFDGNLAYELVQYYLTYYENQLITQKRAQWPGLTEKIFSDARFQTALQIIPASLESEKVRLLKDSVQRGNFEPVLAFFSGNMLRKRWIRRTINTVGKVIS